MIDQNSFTFTRIIALQNPWLISLITLAWWLPSPASLSPWVCCVHYCVFVPCCIPCLLQVAIHGSVHYLPRLTSHSGLTMPEPTANYLTHCRESMILKPYMCIRFLTPPVMSLCDVVAKVMWLIFMVHMPIKISIFFSLSRYVGYFVHVCCYGYI